MSAAGPVARAPAWVPALAVAILCNGLAAGVWKHAGADTATFCVLYAIGKTVVGAGLAVSYVAPQRPLERRRGSRPFLGAALLAAVLNGLAWVAYLVAFVRGPLAIVQTVTAGYTAVAAVLAVLWLRERLGRVQALGVGLVVAAGMLLGYSGSAAEGGGQGGPWVAAALAATGLWGASVVVAKYAFGLPGADHPRFFIAQGIGLLMTVLPFGLSFARADLPATASAVATLAVVALYIAADLGTYLALARGPASVVNPLAGLYPIPTIAYAILVLGDIPDGIGCAAIAMALPGMLLAVPGTWPRRAAAQAADGEPVRWP